MEDKDSSFLKNTMVKQRNFHKKSLRNPAEALKLLLFEYLDYLERRKFGCGGGTIFGP
jgi:hypothetical protein